jgi:hypothetical protein
MDDATGILRLGKCYWRRRTTRQADMSLAGRHIDRNPADGVPEVTSAPCELQQYGDGGVKPDFVRAAIWVQQSAKHGSILAMIE